MPPQTQTIEERIENWKRNSEIVDGHWIYLGAQSNGYGQVEFDDRRVNLHRVSAHLFLGLDLCSPLFALHKTSCPYKKCWNPDCLYIGTQSDNMYDMHENPQWRLSNGKRGSKENQSNAGHPTSDPE